MEFLKHDFARNFGSDFQMKIQRFAKKKGKHFLCTIHRNLCTMHRFVCTVTDLPILDMKSEQIWDITFIIANTGQSAKGALAHHLQRCTDCSAALPFKPKMDKLLKIKRMAKTEL